MEAARTMELSVRRPAVLPAAAAVAVYFNCVANDFTQDDFYYIVQNEQIRHSPWLLFTNPYLGSGLYRPLGLLSYAFNYALHGLHPLGFHAVNVLLHAAVTVLFYLLIRELLERPRTALAAALLFAVHPIHTEAVASAVGRTELLAAGFLLGAWLLHVRGRFWTAALCFLMALMSKESAAAFLVLAPAGDYVRGRLRASRVYACYSAVFAFYVTLWWNAAGQLGLSLIPFLDNPLAELPAFWCILNALKVAWKYLALLLLPWRLSADYSFNAIPVLRSWTALLPALLAGGAVLTVCLWSFRRRRPVFLCFVIYLAGFALTANVLFPIGTIMAERLAYLSSAGLCLLAGLGWEWMASRRTRAAVAALAVVFVAFALRTVVRNRDWRNDFTLFASAVRAAPQSAKARHNLGVQYMNRRDLENARLQFEAAYRIYPEYPDLLGSMGLLFFQTGDKARAERYMEEALGRSGRDNPHYDELATNYAALLIDTGRYDAALALLERTIAAAPRFARAYSNRAVIHYRREEWNLARADLETALRLDPANGQARSLLLRINQR